MYSRLFFYLSRCVYAIRDRKKKQKLKINSKIPVCSKNGALPGYYRIIIIKIENSFRSFDAHFFPNVFFSSSSQRVDLMVFYFLCYFYVVGQQLNKLYVYLHCAIPYEFHFLVYLCMDECLARSVASISLDCVQKINNSKCVHRHTRIQDTFHFNFYCFFFFFFHLNIPFWSL